jgi:hypothetical protein
VRETGGFRLLARLGRRGRRRRRHRRCRRTSSRVRNRTQKPTSDGPLTPITRRCVASKGGLLSGMVCGSETGRGDGESGG